MTYHGHISNGVVVFDDNVTLPEGMVVKVDPIETPESQAESDDDIGTLFECLEPFIGKLEGLPSDASVNLDHYLYGVPKHE
ncbi:MAG: hypothetical protein GX594_15585 [Pirellulaceae bacterium]|nr:hypothetical protein [Pirellulaceae bacterium]